MIVIGLTGSIAMGKSTVAKQFAKLGAAVCDSDHLVHALLAEGGEGVSEVGKIFPQAREGNHINRRALAKAVFGDEEKLKRLETILHPLVRRGQDRFIRLARRHGKRIVILDIPLLFETQGEERVDFTVVATAPSFLQRRRVMKRMHMSEEKFANILKRQMKDSEKRARADFVVHTGLGLRASLNEVRRILARICKKYAIAVA